MYLMFFFIHYTAIYNFAPFLYYNKKGRGILNFFLKIHYSSAKDAFQLFLPGRCESPLKML